MVFRGCKDVLVAPNQGKTARKVSAKANECAFHEPSSIFNTCPLIFSFYPFHREKNYSANLVCCACGGGRYTELLVSDTEGDEYDDWYDPDVTDLPVKTEKGLPDIWNYLHYSLSRNSDIPGKNGFLRGIHKLLRYLWKVYCTSPSYL